MILDVGGKLVETELKKDDLIIFNPGRRTIRFRRGNYHFVFPDNSYEYPFPFREEGFAYFILMLFYASNINPCPDSTEEIDSSISITAIGRNKEKCFTYYF